MRRSKHTKLQTELTKEVSSSSFFAPISTTKDDTCKLLGTILCVYQMSLIIKHLSLGVYIILFVSHVDIHIKFGL